VSRFQQAGVYNRSAHVIATAEVEHSQPVGFVVTTYNSALFLPMRLRPIGGPDNVWVHSCTPIRVLTPDFASLTTRSGWSPSRTGAYQKAWFAVLRSHSLLDYE
jgi:hypothetical protein